MKDLSVAYLSHNRLYYTGITLPRVIDECRRSKRFNMLYIFDDMSSDNTYEFIDSIAGVVDIRIERRTFGNTVDQFNKVIELSKDKYLYYLGNDIIIPEGIFDRMCGFMDKNTGLMSTMVTETSGLPYIRDMGFEEWKFTSSLGIHRLSVFDKPIPNEKRFFGFQPYQTKRMRNGWKVAKMTGIGNTNLDMSAWSKQFYYCDKGYARKGLVGNDNAVFKDEQK